MTTNQTNDSPGTEFTLENIRQVTGINELAIEDVFKRFKKHFQWNGSLISIDKAKGVFGSLIVDAKGFKALRDPNISQLTLQIFEKFDANHDGMLDVIEVLAGLAVLCEGDLDRKAKVLFTVCDENGDGQLDIHELTKLLEGMLGFASLNSGNTPMSRGDVVHAAAVMAQEAFVQCDINEDKRLDYTEFTKWFTAQQASQTPLPQSAVGTSATKPLFGGPSKSQLKIWRNMFGLKHFSPLKVFRAFRESCSGSNTRIDFPSFYKVILRFMTKHHGKWAAKKSNTRNQAFALFCSLDTDNNGSIDFHELGGGVCALCNENPEDLFDVAFEWADLNQDGIITPEEMQYFLEGLFKVMNTSNSTDHTIMSAENRAHLYTEKAFEECDVNNDGFLDRKELTDYLQRTWVRFTGLPRHDKSKEDEEEQTKGGEDDEAKTASDSANPSHWNDTLQNILPDRQSWEHMKEEITHDHEKFAEAGAMMSPIVKLNETKDFHEEGATLSPLSRKYETYGGPTFQSFMQSPTSSLQISPKKSKFQIEREKSTQLNEKQFLDTLEKSFATSELTESPLIKPKKKAIEEEETHFTYTKTYG
eukprot:g4163.t1